MNETKIEWTDLSWNPTTGCNKISTGCDNCYAERVALDLQRRGMPGYEDGFDLKQRPDRLGQPKEIAGSKRIFVNSMSDLFHPFVEFDYIDLVMQVMRQCPQHDFQVLTKRPKTAHFYWVSRGAHVNDLPENFWLGTSIESREWLRRMDDLAQTPARIRFLSLEPLLQHLGDIDLSNIDWVIVGGESGPGCRPMHDDWVRDIRDQCAAADVPFFFKQRHSVRKTYEMPVLDGVIHAAIPNTRQGDLF